MKNTVSLLNESTKKKSTTVGEFFLPAMNTEWKEITILCKVQPRKIQNLITSDVIENIRRSWSIDYLDISLSFLMWENEYSEEMFGKQKFYIYAKERALNFIKQDKNLEKKIVNVYCDTVLSREDKKWIWDTTNKEIVKLISDDKEISLHKDILEPIQSAIKEEKNSIHMDSKYFFLDNGDDLYDDIVQNSPYRIFYIAELELLKDQKEIIWKHIHLYYIGLWCGNGKKDKEMIMAAKEKYEKENLHKDDMNGDQPFKAEQHILLIDSSAKSLSKAEHIFEKDFYILKKDFSQDWVDEFVKTGKIKHNFHSINPDKTPFAQSSTGINDFKNAPKTFNIAWGTMGNFWKEYTPKFLQQVNELMWKWDTLLISLFNKPNTPEKIKETVAAYDNPETERFIKNFFQKIGIPSENIVMEVKYNKVSNTVDVDAKVHWTDSKIQVQVSLNWKSVEIPDGFIFECNKSQRMDQSDLQNYINESWTWLKIIDTITKKDNPFTIYVVEKQ